MNNVNDFATATLFFVTLLSLLDKAPEVEGEPKSPNSEEEGPSFEHKNCDKLVETEIVAPDGATSVGVSVFNKSSSTPVDACLDGFVNNVSC